MIGVAGYLCLDIYPDLRKGAFAFTPGALREMGKAPRVTAGGAVGNTGRALCRLDVPTRLGAVTGDDLFGEVLGSLLKRTAGAGELCLAMLPGESSACSIVLSPEREDRMFLAWRGVNDRLSSESFPPEFLRGLRIFHFGYPPLCRGMALQNGAELKRLFARCRAAGILTSLDMSLPSPGTFSYELDWKMFLANVLPETDLFCPSLDEIRFMLQTPAADAGELSDRLFDLGANTVFLKLGKEGAELRTADTDRVEECFARFGRNRWRGLCCRIAPRPVAVVQSSGAGDAAVAGLLAAVRSGHGGVEAAEFAVRLAETVVAGREITSKGASV